MLVLVGLTMLLSGGPLAAAASAAGPTQEVSEEDDAGHAGALDWVTESFAFQPDLLHALAYRPRYGPHESVQATLRGQFEAVATGIEFVAGLAASPDGRLFASELRTGRIVALNPDGRGGFVAEQFATVPLPDEMVGEQGLWQMAVHPEQPYVYAAAIHQTDPEDGYRGTSRVVRFEVLPDGSAGPLEDVVVGIPAAAAHNGGSIAFGPDGKLYVTVGDTGREEGYPADLLRHVDEPGHPVELPDLRGAVLRFNADGTVPEDGALRADSPLFAFGFRNPYGLAIASDGTLYVTENGPECCDQVLQVEAGANHGWPTYGHVAGEMAAKAEDPFVVSPLVHSGDLRPSPTEIVFYAGEGYGGALEGTLLYGNFHTGTLHGVDFAEREEPREEILVKLPLAERAEFQAAGGIVGVTIGADGFVYFSSLDTVYRLTGVGADAGEFVQQYLGEPALLTLLNDLVREAERVAGEARFVGLTEPAQLIEPENHCPEGEAPTFIHGFEFLKDLLGEEAVGDAMTCEFPDPEGTGDVYQLTTRGILYWNRAANVPAFSDGWEWWAITEQGLLDGAAGGDHFPGVSDVGRGAAELSDADQELVYQAALARQLAAMATSQIRVFELVRTPAPQDPSWTLELAIHTTSWRGIHQSARQLIPPSHFEEMHDRYLAAVSLFVGVGQEVRLAVHRDGLERLERPAAMAEAATELVREIGVLMAD